MEKNSWEYNVWNCHAPVERVVMISNSKYRHKSQYKTLRAGRILAELNISKDVSELHLCGRWNWIEFVYIKDAIAFKLRW